MRRLKVRTLLVTPNFFSLSPKFTRLRIFLSTRHARCCVLCAQVERISKTYQHIHTHFIILQTPTSYFYKNVPFANCECTYLPPPSWKTRGYWLGSVVQCLFEHRCELMMGFGSFLCMGPLALDSMCQLIVFSTTFVC